MRILFASLVTVCTIAAVACSGEAGPAGRTGDAGVDGVDGVRGQEGPNGSDGTSCTVTDSSDGTKTIECEDGTTAEVSDGTDGADGTDGDDGDAGADGTSCTVTDNSDGTKTISCEDGTEVSISDGLRSLIAVAQESPGGSCPTGGQRVDSGLDDDRDGVLDAAEIDATVFLCKHDCTAPLTKNFYELATMQTAQLDLAEVTITGDPGNVSVLEFNGVGVVGGVSNNLVDGTESLTFAFDDLATAVSYNVISAGDESGNLTFGEAMIEAFGATGRSLGTVAVTNTGAKDVSALFGGKLISSFVVTASVDGFRTDHMSFRHCL